mgnify:CR=1 FL=1
MVSFAKCHNYIQNSIVKNDFQLNKNELRESGKIQELADKIRRACELRADNKVLAAMDVKQQEQERLLAELKKILQ